MQLSGEGKFTDVFDIEGIEERARALDIMSNLKNYPKLEIMRDKSVEAANIKARKMFGNVSFADPRLQLLNFTIVPNRRKCVKKDFVVVVHIRVEDQLGRNRWRQTYGDPQLMHKFMYTLVFSVGFPNSTKQQEKLKNESRVHEDVLQADYIDAYRNLTLKQLAELRFLASSCRNVRAVVKLDDDVGWNVEKTAQFIRTNLTTNEIFCARISTMDSSSCAQELGGRYTKIHLKLARDIELSKGNHNLSGIAVDQKNSINPKYPEEKKGKKTSSTGRN
ncbi:N-acetyllactosaminide 3-alpha-galactosyltransferase [Ancylostoma ceylanicum]|uniref:Hexosyltransferase n=1 Tax=Ancylostoma ceylanicum TaxID=53326 RepID=A0A0D6LFR8_9BILA|nr:N-acetyllactosaminide 3-alpha-galactosyltransferase [Ancylostoma ceylanicum]